MGGSIRKRPYGTQVDQMWATVFGKLVKESNMGLIWALDVFRNPHGLNMGPLWAEVYESAHMGHKWAKCGLQYLVN